MLKEIKNKKMKTTRKLYQKKKVINKIKQN